ncbi:MAG: hexokinase [Candidatus Omnitrophota bacterium]|nr:hexokinase [Candidatus Omnitrophota bacterium]
MAMEGIEKLFELPLPAMKHLIDSFRLEMARGLKDAKSSLKMIPTYIGMPTGREKGEFMALDLGGTNFRVLKLTLKGKRRAGLPRMMEFALGKKQITGNAGIFFDFIADHVKIFLKKHNLSDIPSIGLGFTFSFPIRQTSVSGGILICWTKGFETSGVVGNDVVRLMNEAFARRGVKNIRISALVNDTVGTLVAKSYEDPFCDVGVIIGTGTNACYPEALRSIKKWRGPKAKSARMIINTEWGNFNKLSRTSYDRQLDENSNNEGRQILEKMVSGMYMGEIVRLALKDAGVLFKRSVFEAEYMSIIEGDKTDDLRLTGELLAGMLRRKSSVNDRRIIRRTCEIVSRRAARISAACIAAIIKKMDPYLGRAHTIAIDGSVFEKHPTFSRNMEEALEEIFGPKSSLIKLVLAKDGSGKGAAIAAAAA